MARSIHVPHCIACTCMYNDMDESSVFHTVRTCPALPNQTKVPETWLGPLDPCLTTRTRPDSRGACACGCRGNSTMSCLSSDSSPIGNVHKVSRYLPGIGRDRHKMLYLLTSVPTTLSRLLHHSSHQTRQGKSEWRGKSPVRALIMGQWETWRTLRMAR